MGRMKVFQQNGRIKYSGVGIWARMVMDRFPLLPCEDDGRLHDDRIRENFISRVYTLMRWKEAFSGHMDSGRLVDFHTRHKMLIMAHNEKIYRDMGKLVAAAGTADSEKLFSDYLEMLLSALSYKPTIKKHVNVLVHALGHFKKNISSDEKQEMLELIEQYRNGLVPLIVPVTMINHHVRRHGKEYLAGQYYLNPYPAELMLRNHI